MRHGLGEGNDARRQMHLRCRSPPLKRPERSAQENMGAEKRSVKPAKQPRAFRKRRERLRKRSRPKRVIPPRMSADSESLCEYRLFPFAKLRAIRGSPSASSFSADFLMRGGESDAEMEKGEVFSPRLRVKPFLASCFGLLMSEDQCK